MRHYVILLGLGIILWPTIGQPAAAASFTLGERERQDAIAAGRRSVVSEEFGAEWRARNAAGETLVVMTPFHRLALAARNAAFKGESLKPRDIETAAKETSGKLTVWVTLKGATADFARFPAAGLGGKGRVTLVVRNPDDKDVSTFTVDLSVMR